MRNNVLRDNNNCINEFIYSHTIKCESCVFSQVLFLVESLKRIPNCNTDSSVFQPHREVIFHRKASSPGSAHSVLGDRREEVYQGLSNTGREGRNVSQILSAPESPIPSHLLGTSSQQSRMPKHAWANEKRKTQAISSMCSQ